MHPDAAAQVAALVSAVTLGPPWQDRSGLTVIPLQSAGSGAGPSAAVDAGGLVAAETDPPAVDRLVVTNRGRHPVAMVTGDLLVGGLADRAVREAVVVPAGETCSVAVEAVEARWWRAGPPALAGAADPPISAAVALAGLGEHAGGGLAAMTRTCLWAVAGPGGLAPPERPESTMARGWVLLGSGAVLAARLWGRPRPVPVGGATAIDTALPPPRLDVARRFVAALEAVRWAEFSGAVAEGAIDGHRVRVLRHQGAVVEVSAVRLSAELATALLAAHPAA